MSTDLPLLTDMKPRLVTTLAGNPGGRVMQSFTRAPWTDEYYVAYVDSVVSGGPSNLRIARCDSSGAMLDYAVLQGGGHGASITAEYESGKVWIWLFWGSDVGYGTGTAVRWAYNGTPNGATVLLADAQTVPDPGAGDPGHVNGYFAIDQAKDRLATKFSSGTTETYTLWKLSDYKAGTGSPLFTAPTTWPTGDKSAFQGFTTSDKALYITRGGSSVTDQAPTLYQLDWATGAITASMDISQLAATTSAGADGGHNEAEGVCLWRDSGGNPELLFGIDTGPTSNRSGLIFRLAAPVDGTATKTVQIDAENVTGASATNVVASFRYDRTVRSSTGGFTPTAFEQPVKLSESSTVELKVSDHPDLTDYSYGFVIYVTLAWDDQANPGRRKQATYTAQLSATDPAVVTLSSRLVAAGAVPAGQVIAGAPGHSPVVTLVDDQLVIDGMPVGDSLKGAPGGSDEATASWISDGTETAAALRAKVATIALGVKTDSFRVTASSDGDQASALTAFLADSTLSGVRRIVGTANVSASVVVPAGVAVDLRQGALVQTTPNISALTLTAGARVEGGQLVGLATDYVARTGSYTPTAIGIRVAGSGTTDKTYIEGTVLVGFGQTGIYANLAPYTTIEDVEIYGPNGIGGVTIANGDAGCMGVYVNLGCTDMTVRNLRVENTSIGFVNSGDSLRTTLIGTRFRNIPGQHGAYIQNGTGLQVANLVGDSVALNLIKLQIHSSNGAHQFAPAFGQISGTNIGDCVLMLMNTDADLTGSWKIFAPSITGIAGYNAGRVLYLGSVVGASVAGVTGHSTVNDFATVIDAQDSVLEGMASHGSGKVGVRVTSSTGSTTSRLTLKSARVYDPGGLNVGGNKQGVSIVCTGSPTDGQNITVDDVHSFCDTGNMDYGIQMSAGDTSTYRQRNCTAVGFNARAFALPAGTTALKEWNNNDGGGKATLNYPTGAPVRTGSNGDQTIYSCSRIPTSGVFVVSDLVNNSATVPAGSPGWVCTTAGGGYSGTWTTGTVYTAGTCVRTSNGHALQCTVGGTSGATDPATGAVTVGGNFNDGGVTWVWTSNTLAVFKAMPVVAA